MERDNVTEESVRRDRAQMECWSRAVEKIKENNGWTSLKTAEWLLSRPHDIFESLLI